MTSSASARCSAAFPPACSCSALCACSTSVAENNSSYLKIVSKGLKSVNGCLERNLNKPSWLVLARGDTIRFSSIAASGCFRLLLAIKLI